MQKRYVACLVAVVAFFGVSCSFAVNVQDYRDLILYNGPDTQAVVTDPVYGGTFDLVAGSYVEDHGTVIKSRYGGYWVRQLAQMNGKNIFEPKFWPIGAKSLYTVSTSKVVEPMDQINAATAAADVVGGGVVLISDNYTIDQSISTYQNVDLIGNGTVRPILKRSDVLSAVLTSDYTVGDDYLYVDQVPAGLRKGQQLQIITIDPGGTYSSFGHNAGLSNVLVSKAIDSTTIKINGDFDYGMSAGDTVITISKMVKTGGGGYPDDITIDNLEFDGNWVNPNGAGNELVYDWRMNTTMGLFIGENIEITNNVFRNTPNENIVIGGNGVLVDNNEAYDLGGSFVHLSSPVTNPAWSNITNNYVDGTNLGPADGTNSSPQACGHCEGAVTFSAKVINYNVKFNTFKNFDLFAGKMGNDDHDVVLTDNEIYRDGAMAVYMVSTDLEEDDAWLDQFTPEVNTYYGTSPYVLFADGR